MVPDPASDLEEANVLLSSVFQGGDVGRMQLFSIQETGLL